MSGHMNHAPGSPTSDKANGDVHPESIIKTAQGRIVQLKVHRCHWSGLFPENSLPAIEECFRERVARAEIDISMLCDGDFLVAHDYEPGRETIAGQRVLRYSEITRREAAEFQLMWQGALSSHRPPLLSEVVSVISAEVRNSATPTFLELDMMDREPLPWPRVQELVQIVQPVKHSVIFNGMDWNLRRLLTIDPDLLVGFDPGAYLDWVLDDNTEEIASIERYLPRGAYGYFDRHPLASRRLTSVADYLADRLGGILGLVPGLLDTHLRLSAFERMLDDGVSDIVDLFHRHGVALDVWTLDAGTPRWRERLTRALDAGVDCVTTNTPRELAKDL